MGRLYNTLDNVENARRIGIHNLNEQGITTPEDATLHKVMDNIKLGVNGIDMWNTSYQMKSVNDLKNTIKTIPLLDTSQVTNMSSMFAEFKSLETIPLLDTNKVTNMNDMFKWDSNLKSIPQLDTSNVTNMSNMFDSCSKLTRIPPLNIGKVTNMYGAFQWCGHLKEIDISLAPILPNCSMSFAFKGVSINCLIKVYDEASKQIILKSFPSLTNVVVVNK